MIIHKITYRGVDLSDTLGLTTRIVIQDVQKDVKLRTQLFSKENYHGSNSSQTLADGRLFSFKGVIFGDRSQKATGQQILNDIIKPEWLPSDTQRWFYELSWFDDAWVEMKVQAKVYTMPKYENELWEPIINFTFELYSEEATYKWFTDKTDSAWYGLYGWMTLPSVLPFNLNDYVWITSITNNGNFVSPLRIEIIGSIMNPKILNLTTGRYYKLDWYTSIDLVIDNTSNIFLVEDNWVNVKSYRAAWSQLLFLEVWSNNIVLLWDDYNVNWNTVTVNYYWNDTYISS